MIRHLGLLAEKWSEFLSLFTGEVFFWLSVLILVLVVLLIWYLRSRNRL